MVSVNEVYWQIRNSPAGLPISYIADDIADKLLEAGAIYQSGDVYFCNSTDRMKSPSEIPIEALMRQRDELTTMLNLEGWELFIELVETMRGTAEKTALNPKTPDRECLIARAQCDILSRVAGEPERWLAKVEDAIRTKQAERHQRVIEGAVTLGEPV